MRLIHFNEVKEGYALENLAVLFKGSLFLKSNATTPTSLATKNDVDTVYGKISTGIIGEGLIDPSTFPAFEGDIRNKKGSNIFVLLAVGIKGRYVHPVYDSVGRVKSGSAKLMIGSDVKIELPFSVIDFTDTIANSKGHVNNKGLSFRDLIKDHPKKDYLKIHEENIIHKPVRIDVNMKEPTAVINEDGLDAGIAKWFDVNTLEAKKDGYFNLIREGEDWSNGFEDTGPVPPTILKVRAAGGRPWHMQEDFSKAGTGLGKITTRNISDIRLKPLKKASSLFVDRGNLRILNTDNSSSVQFTLNTNGTLIAKEFDETRPEILPKLNNNHARTPFVVRNRHLYTIGLDNKNALYLAIATPRSDSWNTQWVKGPSLPFSDIRSVTMVMINNRIFLFSLIERHVVTITIGIDPTDVIMEMLKTDFDIPANTGLKYGSVSFVHGDYIYIIPGYQAHFANNSVGYVTNTECKEYYRMRVYGTDFRERWEVRKFTGDLVDAERDVYTYKGKIYLLSGVYQSSNSRMKDVNIHEFDEGKLTNHLLAVTSKIEVEQPIQIPPVKEGYWIPNPGNRPGYWKPDPNFPNTQEIANPDYRPGEWILDVQHPDNSNEAIHFDFNKLVKVSGVIVPEGSFYDNVSGTIGPVYEGQTTGLYYDADVNKSIREVTVRGEVRYDTQTLQKHTSVSGRERLINIPGYIGLYEGVYSGGKYVIVMTHKNGKYEAYESYLYRKQTKQVPYLENQNSKTLLTTVFDDTVKMKHAVISVGEFKPVMKWQDEIGTPTIKVPIFDNSRPGYIESMDIIDTDRLVEFPYFIADGGWEPFYKMCPGEATQTNTFYRLRKFWTSIHGTYWKPGYVISLVNIDSQKLLTNPNANYKIFPEDLKKVIAECNSITGYSEKRFNLMYVPIFIGTEFDKNGKITKVRKIVVQARPVNLTSRQNERFMITVIKGGKVQPYLFKQINRKENLVNQKEDPHIGMIWEPPIELPDIWVPPDWGGEWRPDPNNKPGYWEVDPNFPNTIEISNPEYRPGHYIPNPNNKPGYWKPGPSGYILNIANGKKIGGNICTSEMYEGGTTHHPTTRYNGIYVNVNADGSKWKPWGNKILIYGNFSPVSSNVGKVDYIAWLASWDIPDFHGMYEFKIGKDTIVAIVQKDGNGKLSSWGTYKVLGIEKGVYDATTEEGGRADLMFPTESIKDVIIVDDPNDTGAGSTWVDLNKTTSLMSQWTFGEGDYMYAFRDQQQRQGYYHDRDAGVSGGENWEQDEWWVVDMYPWGSRDPKYKNLVDVRYKHIGPANNKGVIYFVYRENGILRIVSHDCYERGGVEFYENGVGKASHPPFYSYYGEAKTIPGGYGEKPANEMEWVPPELFPDVWVEPEGTPTIKVPVLDADRPGYVEHTKVVDLTKLSIMPHVMLAKGSSVRADGVGGERRVWSDGSPKKETVRQRSKYEPINIAGNDMGVGNFFYSWEKVSSEDLKAPFQMNYAFKKDLDAYDDVMRRDDWWGRVTAIMIVFRPITFDKNGTPVKVERYLGVSKSRQSNGGFGNYVGAIEFYKDPEIFTNKPQDPNEGMIWHEGTQYPDIWHPYPPNPVTINEPYPSISCAAATNRLYVSTGYKIWSIDLDGGQNEYDEFLNPAYAPKH